ncbi:uncharacterized protein LOC144665870 [Oculina patagonica]
MEKLCLLVVVFLFVYHANSTSITDSVAKDGKSCKQGACRVKKKFPPSMPSLSRIPYRLLEFLKEQVPNAVPQSRAELEFSAVWLLDETFPKVKTGDFKYIPAGPKGPSTPLLDPSNIFSPSSSKMQNYIVARSMDSRHTPEWVIHKQVTFNRIFNSYKKAKAMLMYSRLHPSKQGATKVCNMKAVMKLSVMVIFSIFRKDFADARKILASCGIQAFQAPPRMPLTKEVRSDILPNIGYVFHGYNFLYGNPVVDPLEGNDPGVSRMPIFKTTFDRGLTTSDMRYLVPDGTSFLKAVSCRIDFSSNEGRSEKSYKDALSNTVGTDNSFLGFGFKASTTVQSKTEELRTASFSYVNTEAVCSVYTGAIFMDLPPKPSDEFIASLSKCDKDPSDENFRNLIDYYGTHFLTDVVMGAKFGEESKIKTDEYEQMEAEGLDVGTAAGYSGKVSAGVTTETSSEREQRERFEGARTSKTSYSYGSNIPSDGDANSWASQSSDDPMPINMDISALSELMTEEFLGDTGIDYEKLKKPLIDYLTQYCSQLEDEQKVKDCMPPTEFAKNGPGLKTYATYADRQVSGVDMIDQHTMAVVHGGPYKGGWKLAILKDSDEVASKDLINKDNVYAFDMVVCRGQRRLGVLLTDTDQFGRIEMYEVSEDGKTITAKEVINLFDSMSEKSIWALYYNCLSFYGDANGFLLSTHTDKVELWKIDGICSTGVYANIKRILYMENWNYHVQAAAHLSGTTFAVSLRAGNVNEIKVVEVLGSDSVYNDSITTFHWSDEMFCTDLFKDDTGTLVALGAENYEQHGRLAAFRWSSEDRKLVFAGDLLTEDFMLEAGSERGVLSVYGQKAYFGEIGELDTGRVMEYQFRYD